MMLAQVASRVVIFWQKIARFEKNNKQTSSQSEVITNLHLLTDFDLGLYHLRLVFDLIKELP